MNSTHTEDHEEYHDTILSEEFAGLVFVDPISVQQALESQDADEWKKSMREEIDALVNNKTWTVVEWPKDKKITGNKWVFRTKLNSDGTVNRRKARLMAKGFSQQKGLNYFETFAPVARTESIRMVMALAVKKIFKFINWTS